MIGATAALGVLLICLWLARGPLGVWAATDYLRRRGVPAQITVERLTLSGFKGGLRLGPVDNPDLIARDVEVDYALFPGRRSALRVTALRLSEVNARLVWDGQRLRYGSLQKLIDDALSAPPSPFPAPGIRFDKTTVRLSTPAGAVVLAGAGEIDDARLKNLAVNFSAPRVAVGDRSAEGVQVSLNVTGDDRLQAQLSMSARAAASGAAKAQGLTLTVNANAPYGRDQRLAGALTAGATLRTAALEAAGWKGEAAMARIDLSGDLAGTYAAPRYHGVAAVSADADSAGAQGLSVMKPSASLASQTFDLAIDKAGIKAGGPLAGRLSAVSGKTSVGGRPMAFSAVTVRGSGQAALSPSGLTGDLAGAAEGRGAFASGDARALADMVFPPDLDARSNAALRKALGNLRLTAPRYQVALTKDGARLSLPQAARIAFDGGALSLASVTADAGPQAVTGTLKAALTGANLPRLDLAVGRYRASSAGFEANGRLNVEGDAYGLQSAKASADLRLTQKGQTVQVDLLSCTPFTVAGYGAPDLILKDAKGQLCPATRPLAVARGGGWRSMVALKDMASGLPTAEAALADAAGTADIQGGERSPLHGDIVLAQGRLTDVAKETRFAPLKVTGRFALNGDIVTGDASAGPNTPVATAQIVHNIAKGTGRAVLAPTTLTFAPDGLQPGQLSPNAALLTKVAGPVQAAATVTWTREALDGVARVSTDGMEMTTPAGKLSGVKGAVELTHLVPAMVTAPDQHITAARLDAVTPLTNLDLRFAMNADALTLSAASATLAKGKASLDPMTVPLAPNATLTGTARLADVDLGEVLAGFNLSDSVTMQARIEALLPFSLSPEGLRFKEGRIAATGPGRLSIKRAALTGVSASATQAAPGAPPPAPTQTNAVQDFAYQALENLAFDALDAKVDSRPEGRLGVVFHLKGRNDPPVKQKAKIKVTDLARGTAFDKPIPLPSGTPVELTLDTSLNFDDLMAAYARIGRSDAVQP